MEPSNLSVEQQSLINLYMEEILNINKVINLTRITDPETAKILHIEDSLVALPELNSAPDGLYGDMGSGGGIPGVFLGIASNRNTVLIDSVKKKMTAVEGILEKIGLTNQITTYSGRLEDLAKERNGQFSALTARALSKLPSLLELASPLLKIGGCLICLKAQLPNDELVQAKKLQQTLGMKLISHRKLTLSDNETHREILVFQKYSKPKIKLPRRVGLAQNNPLTK